MHEQFENWLISKDCYGNRMIADKEKPAIIKRFKELDNIKVIKGDINKDKPNEILIDITPEGWKGKPVWVNLAHHIRPCLCNKCDHKYQSECYLEDCACCTDECT